MLLRSGQPFRCSVRHVWGERRRLIACAVTTCAAAAAWLAAPGGAEPTTTCGAVLPPSAGAYLGVSGLGNSGLAAFEQRVGRRLGWVGLSQPWYRGLAFPRQRVLAIWRHGAIPFVSFLPTSSAYVPDILHATTVLNAREQNPIFLYSALAIIYFIACYSLSLLVRYLERKNDMRMQAA